MNESKSDLVSFVIPVFNSERFLSESLESVINQTYTNIEIIAVYDESDDSSIEILKSFCNRDERMKIIYGAGNGLSHALNLGIDNTKGKLIARMDADDISHLNRIEKQVNYLNKNNLDFCGSHITFIDNLGRVNGLKSMPVTHKACTLCSSIEVPFMHPTVLMRRSFLQENDLRYGQSKYKAAEDYDLWVRAFGKGAIFGNIDESLVYFRVLKDSASRNNSPMLKETKKISKNFFNNYFKDCEEILNNLSKDGSFAEKKICLRFILKSIFRKGKLTYLKKIKYFEMKIIIESIFSELNYLVRR